MIRRTALLAALILVLSVVAAHYAERHAPAVRASFAAGDEAESRAIAREFMRLLVHKCDHDTGLTLAGEKCI